MSRHDRRATAGRMRRALRAIGIVAGGAVTFCLAAACGAVLHAGTPPARRFVARTVNKLLASSFQGTLTIEQVDDLGLGRVSVARAVVRDASGRPVLVLDGVRADVGVLRTARSAVFGKGNLVIDVARVRIANVEAVLDTAPDGELDLVHAFDPRTPPSHPADPDARGVELSLRDVAIAHGWAHGKLLAALPPLDADVSHVEGRFYLDPKTTTLDLTHVELLTRNVPEEANPEGAFVGHLRIPSRVAGESLDASASFVGVVARQPLTAHASMTGKAVLALVDVPRIDPGTLGAARSLVPLQDPGSVHLEVNGTLPSLHATAHAVVGPGTVDLSADARVQTVISANVEVDANRIDIHSFSPDSVHSNLSARTTASFTTSAGLVDGSFTVQSAVGQLAGQVVPPAQVKGRFTRDTVAGSATIDEVGAPTLVDFNLHPTALPGSARVLDFDASSTARDLAKVPRIARAASGRAHLRARGRIELPGARVSGRAEAEVEQIRASHGEIQLGSGKLDATVQGPIASVAVDAHATGQGLSLGNYSFKSFDVRTTGTPRSAHVVASLVGENTPDVRLDTHVAPGSVTTLDHVHLGLRHKDVDVIARVGRVRVGGGVTVLEDVTVDGAGTLPLRANVTLRSGSVAIKAQGGDVDLGRIGRLLDREHTLRKGHVAIDVDVNATRTNATGTLKIDLSQGEFANVNGASGRLEARFDGRNLKAELRGNAGEIGWVTLSTDDAVLGGPLADAATWQKAVGHVTIDTDVDLAKVARLVPEEWMPIEEETGRLTVKAAFGREHPTDLPDVDAEVATRGLGFVLKQQKPKDPNGVDVRPAPPVRDTDVLIKPPFRSHGNDVQVALHLKGKTHATTLLARVVDRHGIIVQLDASGSPPYERLVQEGKAAVADLGKLPLDVQVLVPTRAFSDFPEIPGVQALRGSVEAALHVSGTALAPRVELKARGFDVTGSTSVHPTLVNVDLLATYEKDEAKLVAKVARPDGLVAEIDAGATVTLADLLNPEGATSPWVGHGAAHFDGFPIDTLPKLAANRVHGKLSGDVTLDGLHQAARADAKLRLSELRVGQARYKDGTIAAHAENGTVTGAVRLDQTDGFAEAHADGGLVWGAALAPSIDEARPLTATLVSKQFRAAIAQPFLGESISELDGRIDSDAKLTYDFARKDGTVVGGVDLREGLFEAPSVGGEFHAVRAHVTMDRLGIVNVTDLSASGTTGRLEGSATVKLAGLRLASADGKIHINQREKIPVQVDGVPMGQVWGDVAVKAQVSNAGKDVSAQVTVPKLYVELPQSTGHTVQPLDPNPDVTVGVRERKGRFATVLLVKPVEPRPPQATRTHVAVAFGKEVWVKRDTMLKVQLHGGPVVDITDRTHVTGQIVAGPGTVEVQGKKFELERATVSFVHDDPSDPQIVATAHWDAPSKTRVFVDVTGTPEKLNVGFRSEPDQLPRDAILSLILFGDENGSFGSGQSGNATDNEDVGQAAGFAGGVVTQGINKAISGVTSVDITTRLDTSESQNPRPELAVQVTKDVSATVAYNLGLPPPGQNPDRTQIILDYRFVRNWSLLTTFGDAGSSIVDLLWQYRY